jgi:hypothetical protein
MLVFSLARHNLPSWPVSRFKQEFRQVRQQIHPTAKAQVKFRPATDPAYSRLMNPHADNSILIAAVITRSTGQPGTEEQIKE